jgi:hypothetical protein
MDAIYQIQDALRDEGDRVETRKVIMAVNLVMAGKFLPTATDLAVEHHMKKMNLMPTNVASNLEEKK